MMLDENAKKELMLHIRSHMTYPATKQAVINACNMMEHVPAEARKMAQEIPDKMYNSADEVVKALGL